MATPNQLAAVQIAAAARVAGLALARLGRRAPGVFGRRTAWLALFVGAAALTQVPPRAHAAQANDGPNIVLIGIDSLRPDHLSANGYDRPTSPHIDALLAQSVVFDSAWSEIARTYPSWTSIITGTWPTGDGIRDNLPSPADLVPRSRTAAQICRRRAGTRPLPRRQPVLLHGAPDGLEPDLAATGDADQLRGQCQ